MDAVKYYSFYNAITLREAVDHLGADHVRYLASDEDHWARRITNRVRGAWTANNGRSHGAYCALMQAGIVVSPEAGRRRMMILFCTTGVGCEHEYQDVRYGKNMRVHEPCEEDGPNMGSATCTVCGRIRPIPDYAPNLRVVKESEA